VGWAASAIVNLVNDSKDIRIDTLAVADGLRPVLLRVGRELRREAREVGVSPEQVSLLVAVKYAPGIGIGDLAARERVSAPAMSNHVDRLERAGLVTRTPSTDDKRRVGLSLTGEGQRVLRRVRSRRTAWLASRLGKLDPAELAAVEAAVAPLARLLYPVDRL
jgi:DNA-binding MarR family transcriptional regulator